MAPPAEDDASFLTILLDITSSLWQSATTELGPSQLLTQLLAFINTYVLMNASNRLAVFAAGRSGSYLLYGNAHTSALEIDCVAAGGELLEKLQQALALEAGMPGPHLGGGLSSGLSRALCYMNRVQKAGGGADGAGGTSGCRLLCISGSPDDPRQYISVMNAIFSAQRSEVAIDCCKLGEGHSTLLQQAAFITNGIYTRPTKPEALLEYLLSAYACDPSSRQLIRLPKPWSVDFRASCFCHKRSIDIGFVCSVCLSIFCEKLPTCITCGADFEAAAMKQQ